MLAVGSTVIDATPTPVKEWAVAHVRHRRQADPRRQRRPRAPCSLAARHRTRVARRTQHRRWPCSVALAPDRRCRCRGAAAGPASRPASTSSPARHGGSPACCSRPGCLGLLRTALGRAATGDRLARDADPDHTARAPGRPQRPTQRSSLGGRRWPPSAAAAVRRARPGARPAVPSPDAVTLPAASDAPRPAAAGIEATVRGISAFRTPNTRLLPGRHRAGDPPRRRRRLEAHHRRRRRPARSRSTFDELLTMPLIERDITLTCVSNEVGGPYVGAARWLGVRRSDLLERAGIRAGVDQILSHSTDGMTISTPVQALTDDRDALVAIAMNGEPLPAMHGFPARLVTPGLYGFVGATKWLTRITATTYAAENAYWTERGWATDGRDPDPVAHRHPARPAPARQRASRHRRGRLGPGPRHREGRGPGRRRPVAGGHARPRRRHRLLAPVVPPWDAPPGRHELTVRATDLNGDVQPESEPLPSPVAPPAGTPSSSSSTRTAAPRLTCDHAGPVRS